MQCQPTAVYISLVLVSVFAQSIAVGVQGYFPPYTQPYPYQWPQQVTQQVPQIQAQNPAVVNNEAALRSPMIPGSPMWKRIQFIERYNAMQRARESPIYSDPVSKGSASSFELRSLNYHNLHRHLHQSDSLKLDHKMSMQASTYAKKLANDMGIKHSPEKTRKGQSENIAVGCKLSGPGLTAFETLKYWYETLCHNNWRAPSTNGKSRPFTNLIWKSSKKFGIGRASFKTKGGYNCTVIVARYSPEGSKGSSVDYKHNVQLGNFRPDVCQYTNAKDKPDFIQPSMKCAGTDDFHGQMVERDSACTIAELFATFGASRRKGKLAFRVVL